MTTIEVEGVVKAEIGDRKGHCGIDFTKSLVKPYRELCDSGEKSAEKVLVFEVWVVLDERPGEKSSYVIAYDEDGLPDHPYVLAIWNDSGSGLTYLGHYRSFFDAIEGM